MVSHPYTNSCAQLPMTLSAEAQEQVIVKKATASRSPYACPHAAALRKESRIQDEANALRSSFARDIEKIMHLPFYNRLAGKTQVFSFRAHDGLTRRGLHVQLVARCARTIGQALGLNLDLIEAIALSHDVGHTPFGHAGERFLSEVSYAHTGRSFYHNVQSARILHELSGRNISLQVIDGALCHNGEFEQQVLRMGDSYGFEELDTKLEACWYHGEEMIPHLRPTTLEGCVVRLADIIAYVGKDRQDALRAGLLRDEDFEDGLGSAYNAWALTAFVVDIVEHSLGKDRIQMSEAGFQELKRAKRENYAKIYGSAEVDGDFSQGVRELFARLYDHELEQLKRGDEHSAIFAHHIAGMNSRLSFYGKRYDWEIDPDRCVVDFIASMTDDYFIATVEHLFPESASQLPLRGYFTHTVHP